MRAASAVHIVRSCKHFFNGQETATESPVAEATFSLTLKSLTQGEGMRAHKPEIELDGTAKTLL